MRLGNFANHRPFFFLDDFLDDLARLALERCSCPGLALMAGHMAPGRSSGKVQSRTMTSFRLVRRPRLFVLFTSSPSARSRRISTVASFCCFSVKDALDECSAGRIACADVGISFDDSSCDRVNVDNDRPRLTFPVCELLRRH